MDREVLKDIIELLNHVENRFGNAPYVDAVDGIRKLHEVKDIITDDMPGGYFGFCASCDIPMGNDEAVNAGDEHFCMDCYGQMEAEHRAGGDDG